MKHTAAAQNHREFGSELLAAYKYNYVLRGGSGQEYPSTKCCLFICFRALRSISKELSAKMNALQIAEGSKKKSST
jgi:hypothetical protein